jgi:hypothetical protein
MSDPLTEWSSRSAVPVLHVHGQLLWHDDATIVANGSALLALRDLIDSALTGVLAQSMFTVSDGEGYELTIKLEPALFGEPAWDRHRLPYIDPIANPDASMRDV